ncbi:23S rRNA (guanosine(2251)-2'-O)-methyltransferase RlmB [Mycoplasma phocimorsus]|uniref:23S rRNA (Guanosine(2251)-2'-O)-methyltransferase RlmB n=1 Tax=Mycoplasma phocimorsus TaxID=3045839 RepID=A0AAJ1UVZ2_9MOLU|nr:23S rRNA (guanosine(2251)-2'-O)-methyltransferase RlmB [Mycoplasma phocimorsus]MDJ1646049.1 23S rRNA (guanosine(2251)-2'-O)-methyltransferase RlmB [Mycoplasma phocimorsus]MDJ1646353.1 23S rRNA (guanosine(2251)-2'-O)-methyltransferase RlmB [Mycoplasma phocimorsus]MDJ1647082.1 23S rRNA (guanosine(2251)-2'-O)-methyltransferase RlmB [Mycoplasma phocimorsus]MDJ1647522.1 23S rRNA (guanosine(2251)-2'-O)-methyltransferase RlmB [Mycoplasma phocimorsus]MDJ1648140.1 23S rRNA (guanosine(2251)-2'-O)-met
MNENLYISGKNSVIDAIKNNWPISVVYIDNISKKIECDVKFILKNKSFFEKYSKTNHQGYIAIIKNISYYDLNSIKKDQAQNVLVLDHIQDVGNFGAIIRSANAFGFNHIIFPKDRAAQITSTVLKTSSGGFLNIKFIKVNSISSTLLKLKNMGYWIYASVLNSKSVDIKKIEINYPGVLVIGSEATGCSKSTINMADILVHIKMYGNIQSLNASVAAGILMNDWRK